MQRPKPALIGKIGRCGSAFRAIELGSISQNWLKTARSIICPSVQIRPVIRLMLTIMLGLTMLTGCVNLVRPNYSQNLAELRSGDYTLDKEHAYVIFKVGHLGLSTIVGRFNVVEGELDFDPSSISQMVLKGVIQAGSIDLNNDDLEERLQGSDWFDSKRFPAIAFASTLVSSDNKGALVITGDLTIRGVTKQIVLQANFNGGADNILTGKYTLGFSANTQLKRSDFGMSSFAALVADDIEVELHGEFQRN